ncbi:hypothetical protein VQ02_20290 [Methylobacterium variabile]|uniref:Uncharacterized protein n=2 Tax=Methylobacterium TaxID=407 RepID=A0A0J6SJU5_9HYPH|nr:hypothetical protein VQ02_20290 [Methylobacterium variabile]KMO37524.1 hypothetical protein VP06_08355 [Methylobacterium aquaticum]
MMLQLLDTFLKRVEPCYELLISQVRRIDVEARPAIGPLLLSTSVVILEFRSIFFLQFRIYCGIGCCRYQSWHRGCEYSRQGCIS